MLASLTREGAVEQVPGDTRYRLGAADRRRSPRASSRRAASSRSRGRSSSSWRRLPARRPACRSPTARRPLRRPGRHDPPGPGPRLDRVARPDARGLVGPGVPRPHELGRRSSATSRCRAVAFTARTITDSAALRERLRTVQLDGYAWVREEFAEGLNSRRGAGRRRGRRDRRGRPRPRAVVPLPGTPAADAEVARPCRRGGAERLRAAARRLARDQRVGRGEVVGQQWRAVRDGGDISASVARRAGSVRSRSSDAAIASSGSPSPATTMTLPETPSRSRCRRSRRRRRPRAGSRRTLPAAAARRRR